MEHETPAGKPAGPDRPAKWSGTTKYVLRQQQYVHGCILQKREKWRTKSLKKVCTGMYSESQGSIDRLRLSIWNPDKYYTWYIPCICHVYTMYIPRAGIYMVYTMYIHGILKCKFLVFFRILLLWTHAMCEDNVMSKADYFKTAYLSFKFRQRNSMVYTRYIIGMQGICYTYTRFSNI